MHDPVARANRYLDGQILPGDAPGIAVTVARNGTEEFRWTRGLANIECKEPLGRNSRFLLASVTKQFTALAIMQLVEDGLLSYERRLSELFPWFRECAREISVRHLLQHTAGFPEYRDLFTPTTPMLSAELLAKLSKNTALFKPGSRYQYSNSGYVILGQIVEHISGKSYAEYLQEHIFGPSGTTTASVPVEKWESLPNLVRGYSAPRNCIYQRADVNDPFKLVYGEDGIYASLDDMIQWDRVLYTNKLIKQSSLQDAFTNGVPVGDGYNDYGFGWFLGWDSVWHDGEYDGFRTYIGRYRSPRLTVIVLCNCAEYQAPTIGSTIAGHFL